MAASAAIYLAKLARNYLALLRFLYIMVIPIENLKA